MPHDAYYGHLRKRLSGITRNHCQSVNFFFHAHTGLGRKAKSTSCTAGGKEVLPFPLNSSHLATFTWNGPIAGPNPSTWCKARSTTECRPPARALSIYQAWRGNLTLIIRMHPCRLDTIFWRAKAVCLGPPEDTYCSHLRISYFNKLLTEFNFETRSRIGLRDTREWPSIHTEGHLAALQTRKSEGHSRARMSLMQDPADPASCFKTD